MNLSKNSRRHRQSQRPIDEGWRRNWYDIIFEADSPAGRWFDIGILVAILVSIVVIAMETVEELAAYKNWFIAIELVLTVLFTVEYVLRLICVEKPLKYAISFWGIIDLLSFLPTYATLMLGNSTRSFVILRSIRLLRVFRVLKLWRMMNDADELSTAVWKARHKIVVFLCVVLVAVTISGTLMYNIENVLRADETVPSQFTSIPQSMYWAIVTMTTVGYGDVVPQTNVGKVISAALILLGYSLIIVPSTFVSAEIIQAKSEQPGMDCDVCDAINHPTGAKYCYRCGNKFS